MGEPENLVAIQSKKPEDSEQGATIMQPPSQAEGLEAPWSLWWESKFKG
jgi:hypothetical protein